MFEKKKKSNSKTSINEAWLLASMLPDLSNYHVFASKIVATESRKDHKFLKGLRIDIFDYIEAQRLCRGSWASSVGQRTLCDPMSVY